MKGDVVFQTIDSYLIDNWHLKCLTITRFLLCILTSNKLLKIIQ